MENGTKKKPRMIPRVVTQSTLSLLLSKHTVFSDLDTVDLAEIIAHRAYASRFSDLLVLVGPAFDTWKHTTYFYPKPSFASNVSLTDPAPLWEYAHYGGRTFYRDQVLGVTFATFVPYEGEVIGVAWTTGRKAHLFRPGPSGEWTLFKTLHRQSSPFLTWMRFLGGEDRVALDRPCPLSRIFHRPAESLFHDLVIPVFGSAPHARFLEKGALKRYDPTGSVVLQASLLTVPANDPERHRWRRLY